VRTYSSSRYVWRFRSGGVILVSWFTWQIASLIALRSTTSRSIRRPVVLALIALLVVSRLAPDGEDTGETLTVAAVQGGGPQGTRAIHTDPRDVVERHLDATRTLLDSGATPDLVVWPENVIDVAEFERSREINEVARLSSELDAPFLVGITEDVDAESFTNAQVVVDSSATVLDRYDKVRRVPFGEYMPLRGFLQSLGAPVDLVPRDAVAGTGTAVLSVPADIGQGISESTRRAAVVISWEVFFGGRAREGVKAGGGYIVNPTNGSSYTWTILQSQQVASSRLRAIETGRWVVQVAPTGFSAFVDPTGHVHDRTAVSEQKVITHEIDVRRGRTIYVNTGDGPWIVALVGLLTLAVVGERIRSRSSRSSDRR
jgi:apolipoprotein N-acyltransferase